MSDDLSSAQCRAARSLVGMNQNDLCAAAGITIKTLSDFEAGKTKPYARTLDALRAAMEAAGVVFIPENGGGAGVRLREPGE